MTELVPMSESEHFDLVTLQADMLAGSQIIPKAFQRKAPDIIAAGLAGRAYHWDVMTALRQFHVIEGTASLRPEAMLGLVRQAGHSVLVEFDGDAAVATGKRGDNGDEHVARFSMKDAAAAGLAGKRNWKQYQESMLTWRAVAKLCRVLFPDVVLGAGYVPEELGAVVDRDGDIVDAEIVSELTADEIAGLKAEISGLDGFQKDDLRAWWKAYPLPTIDSGGLTADDAEMIYAKIFDLTGQPVVVPGEAEELFAT